MLCKNLLFENDNTTKLMNHLGGFGIEKMGFELSVVPGSPEGYSLVDGHPGTKGPKFLQVKMLPVQPRVIWALS